MPVFFTLGFQIIAGIQAGAFLGLCTCFLSPTNKCTFLVPRSLNLMSVYPRLAAFKAACLGCLPLNTPISFPFASRSAKFLFSAIFYTSQLPVCIERFTLLHVYISETLILIFCFSSEFGESVYKLLSQFNRRKRYARHWMAFYRSSSSL
jgi:hypothetical protein